MTNFDLGVQTCKVRKITEEEYWGAVPPHQLSWRGVRRYRASPRYSLAQVVARLLGLCFGPSEMSYSYWRWRGGGRGCSCVWTSLFIFHYSTSLLGYRCLASEICLYLFSTSQSCFLLPDSSLPCERYTEPWYSHRTPAGSLDVQIANS